MSGAARRRSYRSNLPCGNVLSRWELASRRDKLYDETRKEKNLKSVRWPLLSSFALPLPLARPLAAGGTGLWRLPGGQVTAYAGVRVFTAF